MSADWPVYKVADLEAAKKLLVQDGNHGEYRPRKNEFVENGTAFIRAADLGYGAVKFDAAEKINEVAFKRIRKGVGADFDTILSTKGTVGKIAFVPEGSPRFVCSPQTSFWRSLDHDFIDPKFLYYELQSKHFLNQISSRKGETDMADYLSLTSQRSLNIRVPDLCEQRDIARILGALDEKIELNRQINQTLEQIAQAIFKSWFVDFGPVKAKIEAKASGRDPERAAMCAISGKSEAELDQLTEEQRQQLSATAALFPDELVESELGLVPEGWEVSTFGTIAKNIRAGVDPTSELPETPYVGLEHIERKHIYLTAWGRAEQVDSNKSRFSTGDILFGKLRPYFHKVSYMPFSGICSTDILVVRAMSTEWQGYVQYQLFNERFVEYSNVRSTGTRMPRANWKDMAQYPMAKPSSDLAAIYNKTVINFNDLAALMVQETNNLATLRDTLLPKLLSGEIRIPEAEKLMEATV
ncbi:restriction endonuclease subunit S [Geothermobacter hydrogeniphilus]|uniref:Restriction endonuclease subunit S n=1 Tax=Geothermobacter hydrogeniphilus TaxID=1969733 RepID=A0A2K2HA33_9BACT|nr:restriction endonuclease subunit S [Geothermobacter hydrogeniphilus]PNU20127.1 restriction endonuclease subunit S [Geothermobacter hydrogeniphilus]